MTSLADLKRLHEAEEPWGDELPTYKDGDEDTMITTDSAEELAIALRNALPALLRCIEAADALVEGFEVEPDFEDCGVENCGDCAYMRRILDYRQARAELEES